jgi:Tfp pilus assembly protein FimT
MQNSTQTSVQSNASAKNSRIPKHGRYVKYLGFSLIELMVIVAIIGILGTLISHYLTEILMAKRNQSSAIQTQQFFKMVRQQAISSQQTLLANTSILGANHAQTLQINFANNNQRLDGIANIDFFLNGNRLQSNALRIGFNSQGFVQILNNNVLQTIQNNQFFEVRFLNAQTNANNNLQGIWRVNNMGQSNVCTPECLSN